MTVKIVLICVAAAMICAAIRLDRPDLAMGVSLAIGTGAVLLVLNGREALGGVIGRLHSLAFSDELLGKTILKAAGIAVISEMGAQICSDAGENALAGRIALASRVAIAGLCCPILEEMLEMLSILA